MPAPAVRQRPSSERGAILIQVGIALVVLVGLSAFVTDYGVFWLARRQAQNAADAGALAGAVSRVFDEQKTTGPITSASVAAATGSHWIIDRQVDAAWVDVAVPNPISDTSECPFQQAIDRGSVCVRVDVFRDSAHGSALPTYFARVFGKDDQDVRARAVAQVVPVTGARCLMPWMAPNVYTAANIGQVLNVDVTEGWWQADFGGATADICVAPPSAPLWVSDAVGTAGDFVTGAPALTIDPSTAATIVAQDASASWDDGVGGVAASCALSSCGCIDPACPNGLAARISPRIVPVGLYDLTGGPGVPAPLRNIAGLFILPPGDPLCLPTAVVCGHLVAFPGDLVSVPASFSAGLNVTPMLIQ
jgi:Putative Flp pilus-assembly TadE/G-like